MVALFFVYLLIVEKLFLYAFMSDFVKGTIIIMWINKE